MGAIETECHFLSECTTYDDIRAQYVCILKSDNMHHLFGEDKINQTASFLVKSQSRRSDMEKIMKLS